MVHSTSRPTPRRRPHLVLWLAGGLSLAVSLLGCRPEEAVRFTEAPLPVPTIRVKLGDDEPNMLVSVNSPVQVRDLKTSDLLLNRSELPGTVFSASRDGLLIDGRPLGTPAAVVIPAGDGTLKVGGSGYRGCLRVLARDGRVRLVNVLDVEQYLVSVVGQETYPHWHIEAMKAQAVAARSYALYQVKQVAAASDFDLYSSQRSQAYAGLASESDNSREAVEATRGVVLAFNDGAGEKILETLYHSTCGGRTVPVEQFFSKARPSPPLGGVTCPYCQFSKHYRWRVEMSADAFCDRLRKNVAGAAALRAIDRVAVRPANLTPDGRVRAVAIWSDGNTDTFGLLPADVFKTLFPPDQRFKSDRFSASLVGKDIVVVGAGFGHGVGMCQYGAEGQARAGRQAAGILSFYYPGARLVRVY